ncbi:MAG: D-alanyl-D-alanine carboxypeptidase [Selenomonadaceae bacterium]|nr:D-alanyl-D-alanine carboxypeptidase [Selenomonadaceae bacterium]
MTVKNFFATIIICAVLVMNSAASAVSEPKISADSAILVEASTGRIIWEKNSDLQHEPASMTKMLTCVLALEKLNQSEEVTMDQAAVFTEDNTLSWAAGESVSARDMITAVMLVSENGGAVALAQKIAGSEFEFAEMMNDKAKKIGCKNSHFVNPNGLPNPNHYSTAADMARIAVYCMKNADFREIVGTRRTSIHWLYPKDKWSELNNTNELLGKYKGANGIKTGWTSAAGGCLAAGAKRGEIELIAIVMRSTNHDTRFEDAAALLNYGFERVRMVNGIDKERTERMVFVRGGKRATVRVKPAESLDFPLMAGEDSKLLKVTYDLPKIVDAGAGIDRGKVLGEAVLRYDGKPVAKVPLVARSSVDAGFSIGSFLVRIVAPLLEK